MTIDKQFSTHSAYLRSSRTNKLMHHPLHLIYSMAIKKVAELTSRPIRLQADTFWGDPMCVVIPETVSVAIFRYKLYEEGLTSFLLRILQPDMTFFDIGAHFGYFSLLASKLIGAEGQVHSFEPTPSTFEILKYNASTRANIVLNNCAVWSSVDKIQLSDYGLKFSAFNSLQSPRMSKSDSENLLKKTHMTDTVSIDEYVRKTAMKPDFIKIDAENAEYQILSGMSDCIRQYKPFISLEVGDMHLNDTTPSYKLVETMLEADYQPFEWCNQQIVAHTPQHRYTYANLLFAPKNRTLGW